MHWSLIEALSHTDASNGDVRQILNMLQMLTVKSKNLAAFSTQELQERLNASLKEIELGPKDAVTKLFNAVEYQKLSLDDKLDLYFIDPSFVPLFIQVSASYRLAFSIRSGQRIIFMANLKCI